MENEQEQPQETPVEEVTETPTEQPVEQQEESLEELKQRLFNAQAENKRKAEELLQAKQEAERLRESRERVHQEESVETILRRMSDRELESYLNNQQYAVNHSQIREILDERRFDKYIAKRNEKQVRLDAEIEVEKNFPEVLNPSSPMAIRTKELMRENHLEGNPKGRLIAARLAASELSVKKAVEAGRKQEQSRQADVKANFNGDTTRTAPVKKESVKDEELKKRAQAGDRAAQAEWFKRRGII